VVEIIRTMALKHPRNRLKYLRMRGKESGTLWLTAEEVSAIRGIKVERYRKQENGQSPLDERDIVAYARIFKVESYEIFVPKLPDQVASDEQS